jgi:hypothetical protein
MKDITFKEFNLDGKMDGYVRNISVEVGGIPMLDIQYHPPHGFCIRERVIPFRVFTDTMDEIKLYSPTEEIKTKEEAKELAIKACEDFYKLFKK